MNTACPTDDRLKQLIHEAFSESAAPDPARLQHIESCLTNKLSENKDNIKARTPHWLLWLFLATSASATAWWGNHYFTEESVPDEEMTSSQVVMPHTKPINEPQPSEASNAHNDESAPPTFRNSPIIDKRERY